MKCSCCNKRKGIFESFEELDKNVHICVECSKDLYKFQDFKNEKNEEEAEKILEQIKKKNSAIEFTKWLNTFVLRVEKKRNG